MLLPSRARGHARVTVTLGMLVLALLGGLLLPSQAAAAPVNLVGGGGYINSSSDEAGAYAFSVHRGDSDYLVTARHVAPAGSVLYGPGGAIGDSELVSKVRDTAYVRLWHGTVSDQMQIGTSEGGTSERVVVSGVARRGDIGVGQPVCHSGYSDYTQDRGGYVCGRIVDVPPSCTAFHPHAACEITMDSGGSRQVGWLGDSGGPVWQWAGPGRVFLLGVFTSVSSPDGGPATRGHFVPAFDVLTELGGAPVSATS
ncbi:MAG: hypothetical protein J2P24_01625 [Streptosporangiales bacterium]|nr:hypothetical protein [Streptosporangiales bacterium]MBO0890320.1 hypothetical protein [Acidothermales bacterium]